MLWKRDMRERFDLYKRSDLPRRGDVQSSSHLRRLADLRGWGNLRICAANMRGLADVRDPADLPWRTHLFGPGQLQWVPDL